LVKRVVFDEVFISRNFCLFLFFAQYIAAANEKGG
jgi:hypothetical protein